MFVTYFYGCWWLPAALTLINVEVVKLGKDDADSSKDNDLIKVAKASAKAEKTTAFTTPDQDDTSCRTHSYEQVEV